MNDGTKPLRVLVVEDCEDDFDLLLLQFKKAGFQPDALRVETIPELETALRVHDWQLVCSDFDLPGFDGLRALEAVRAHSAETPFFMVSGVIDEEQAVAAIKGGAQDYFFKGKLARLGPAVTRELHEAEQRRLRQEAQATLERDRDVLRHDRLRFVDIMSHELRTPLHIINVGASMLARYGDRMDEAARQERVSEIQDAVTRMTGVIDKVLLTSRLELQRWDLRSETFEVNAWCGEFLAKNFTDAQRQRIHGHFENLPSAVAMDRRVIEIALQNLISNALKYSPDDAPVELELRRKYPNRIAFLVRDHGIGIPKADMPHVFNSFYRATNVGSVPGTGLGLAIVKACTELHEGTLHIESDPGSGTCIEMCLPDWLQQEDNLREVSVSRLEWKDESRINH